MDVFNRLKSTVSGVIMGNPVAREFELGSHRASAGPGLLWKVFDGIKHTTKQEVSVFVFEKKSIERYSRRDKELILECLKKGVSQLTRLRHPKILSVLHPLEESRESIAFATEPVFCSLANVLHNTTNTPSPLPDDIKDFKLYDVEIKYGFLQITEGLAFLHTDVKMIHNNLCPSSIMINKMGAWKLCCFDCAIPNANNNDATPYYPFREWDTSLPPAIQPHLDYMAPESILTQSCDTSADIFSLGMLFHSVFNSGKTLFECKEQMTLYKQNVDELRNLRTSVLGSVPADISDHIKLMLNTEPTVRPDAHQICKIPFFEDLGANTLHYLDTLMQRKNLEKSQFFKGLPQVIDKMPKRVNLQRILPTLQNECSNHDMVPFVLPPILLIADQCTQPEYIQHVMPVITPLFKIHNPIQIALIFLQNMPLLLSKTPQTDIKNHVLPMMYHALECNTPQVQELCLRIIPTFAGLIDYTSLKNSVIPRIKKLCLSTQLLSLRVNSLMCIGKMLEFMDKWFVLDEVFPILQAVPSREPAVLMSMLGIYKVTLEHQKLGITKEIMATKVLPYIILLSIDNGLNLSQYNAFTSVIHEMMTQVETEHRSKLEQLSDIQQEQRTLQFTQESVGESKKLVAGVSDGEPKEQSMMDKFLSGFGMGGFASSSTSSSAAAANSSNSSAPLTSPVSSTAKSPSQTNGVASTGKVSLTMEQKQRLAQQQEQQKRLKDQKPLQAMNQSTPSKPANQPMSSQNQSSAINTGTAQQNKVKDLTSTLVNAPNFMSGSGGKQSTQSSILPVGGAGGGLPSTMHPVSPPMMGGASTFSSQSGMGSGGGGMLSPISSQGSAAQQRNNPGQKVDLSAFDNLLGDSGNAKQRMSMKDMSKPTAAASTGGMNAHMGGMNAPMGGMNHMGNTMGGMGNTMGGMNTMGNTMGGMNTMGNTMGSMNTMVTPMGGMNTMGTPMGGMNTMGTPMGGMNNRGASSMGNMGALNQSQNMNKNTSSDFDNLFG